MISIVMPVYNTKPEWLEQSILSCLNQTYQNFELIIIDNGSTDQKTLNTFKRFKNIDKIRLLHCPQQEGRRGISVALNMGIRESRGEYIARMDSDDWMYPERLDKQFTYMETNPEVEILGTQKKTIQENTYSNHPEIIDKFTIINYDIASFLNHPTIMFRKTVFTKVEGYTEIPYMTPEDLDLWVRCLEKGVKIRNLKECLLNYNFHGQNASIVDYTPEWRTNCENLFKRIKNL
jgi:glycosyltransferase involved in cell wall biosynthesis